MSEVNNQAPAAPVKETAAPQTETSVEQNEEVQSQETSTPEQKETAKQEAKKLKQLKYKANGKEFTEELPFEIEENPEIVEYLTKKLSLSQAAQAAMQESSNVKKQVKEFVDYLGKDTAKALAEMGIDVKQLAANVIEDEIKKQQMTPEQKELEELRLAKKQMEEEKQRLKEEAEAAARTAAEQQAYAEIEKQISEAISKTYLPKQPSTVKRVAEYMRIANANGVNVSAAEVMPFVEQDLKAELQAIMTQLGDDNIEDFIGKDVFKKVRKRNLDKAKVPVTPATAKADTVEVKKENKKVEEEKKPKLAKDFFGFKL
jgi:hypothetical protein